MLNCVAHSGLLSRLAMKALSKSLLMNPARSPSSWWLRPPVPITTTFRSLSQLLMASPTALPKAYTRLAEGSGNCTVLMQMGTVSSGRLSSGQNSFTGMVKAWSTSISWQVTRSKSLATSSLMRCHDSGWHPLKGGMVGMPQPSSALRYSGAAPMAKVGILSRKKFSPWSL